MSSTLDVRDAFQQLADGVPAPSDDLAGTALRRSRHRRYATRGAVAGATIAVTIPVAFSIASQDSTPGTTVRPADAPEAPVNDDPAATYDQPAQKGASEQQDEAVEKLSTGGLPLLLVDDTGWKVVHNSGFDRDTGEIAMTDGDRVLDLHWWPGGKFESLLDDRRSGAAAYWEIVVAGRDAVAIKRPNGTFEAIWREGDLSIVLRGGFANSASFEAVLRNVQEVDADTWLAAFAYDPVTPRERPDTVAEMLADIPTPTGFDAGDVTTDSASDRDQLGVDVTRSVLCEWTTRWIAATETGDLAAADEAIAAIASAYDWDILVDMAESSDYPDHVWHIVDNITDDGDKNEVATDLSVELPDPDQPLDVYRNAFGCTK